MAAVLVCLSPSSVSREGWPDSIPSVGGKSGTPAVTSLRKFYTFGFHFSVSNWCVEHLFSSEDRPPKKMFYFFPISAFIPTLSTPHSLSLKNIVGEILKLVSQFSLLKLVRTSFIHPSCEHVKSLYHLLPPGLEALNLGLPNKIQDSHLNLHFK